MEKENIYTTMELNTQVFGKMINNMEMVKKLGLMEHIMKDNMKKGRNMEKGSQFLQIVLCMKDNSIIMTYMDMEFMYGQTIENTKGNGKEIKCTEEEPQHGQMVVVMRESK